MSSRGISKRRLVAVEESGLAFQAQGAAQVLRNLQSIGSSTDYIDVNPGAGHDGSPVPLPEAFGSNRRL